MSKQRDSTRFAKYEPVGGIARAAAKIFDGTWTLAHTGRCLSISRECVRQDVSAFVGAGEYKRRVGLRKEKARQSRLPHTLPTNQALKYLGANPPQGYKPGPGILRFLIQRARGHGQNLSLRVNPGKRPTLLTPGGRPISVRVAVPDGEAPEHKLGLHRINISRLRYQKNAIAIFVLKTPSRACCYIIRSQDIQCMDSIDLRWASLQRRSKYSSALENWGAMAGH